MAEITSRKNGDQGDMDHSTRGKTSPLGGVHNTPQVPAQGRRNEIIMGAPKDFDEYDTRERLRNRGPGYGDTIDILREHK